MFQLNFNIDRQVAKVFSFVLDYTNSNTEELLLDWMNNSKGLHFKQDPSDLIPLTIAVSESEKQDFNNFCRWCLKTETSDNWFESCVRNYCTKQLFSIQRNLCNSNEGITGMTPAINSITKSQAKHLATVNGYVLHNCYTFASRNKSTTDKFWLNPSPDCLENPWTLILNDQINRVLYILDISENSFDGSEFYMRPGRVPNIFISADGTFKDIGPGKADFSKYIIGSINY